MKKEKIKKPKLETDEDDSDEDDGLNKVQIGDISIESKKPLPSCEKFLIKLLKNRTIKNYLQRYELNKKLDLSASYLG